MSEEFQQPIELARIFEPNEKLNISVLFADDDPAYRKSLKDLFEDIYPFSRITIVANGKEVLGELAVLGQDYDILITDNDMPFVTGVQVLRQTRFIKGLENLKIIILTGDIGLESEIKASGGVYMAKPFRGKDLCEKIEELTKKS